MADTDETMMTECWTEAETLAVLNGAMPETPENFLAYSENFFMHGFQDVRKNSEESASLVLGAAQLKFAPALVDVGRSLVEKAQGEERSKSIKLGCAMIREAAEVQGYPEAWQAILEFHEKGIGPFKTNKFARAARAALKELE